jgi:peptide deformylase
MAIRSIRYEGDEILRKKSREIKEATPRIRQLAGDMLDTMYEAQGVGLAGPQVGTLRRIVVIDVGEGPYVMLNPVILESSGEQMGMEGCLSIPGKYGDVLRPMHVKARYDDLDMQEQVVEAEGFFARAICHELDHLDGTLYIDKVEGELYDAEDLQDMEEEDEFE